MSQPGNTELVDYGIQNENSDLRAHVCPKVRRVYVYPTVCGIEAMCSPDAHLVNGYQEGIDIPTAQGYVIPPFRIKRCVALSINDGVWSTLAFSDQDSLTVKGKKATALVRQMIVNGLFPLPAAAQEVTEANLQIEGTDIIIKAGAIEARDIHIQVKCDYPGGEKPLGTGNLFLQVAECNPFKMS